MDRTDVLAKRESTRPAEEQAPLLITLPGVGQLLVDAELAHVRLAIPQSAMRQAVEGHVAAVLDVRHGLELGLHAQVFVEPMCAHTPRRKPGHADELHHVFRRRVGQHLLEGEVGVAFGGHGKGRAQLHRTGAQGLQAHDVGVAGDAAGGNQQD